MLYYCIPLTSLQGEKSVLLPPRKSSVFAIKFVAALPRMTTTLPRDYAKVNPIFMPHLLPLPLFTVTKTKIFASCLF